MAWTEDSESFRVGEHHRLLRARAQAAARLRRRRACPRWARGIEPRPLRPAVRLGAPAARRSRSGRAVNGQDTCGRVGERRHRACVRDPLQSATNRRAESPAQRTGGETTVDHHELGSKSSRRQRTAMPPATISGGATSASAPGNRGLRHERPSCSRQAGVWSATATTSSPAFPLAARQASRLAASTSPSP